MSRVTGETPRLWGSIVGFGQYHYKYESGRQGMLRRPPSRRARLPRLSISPTASARYDEQLKQLGPHTTGVGCLYIKDLDKIDISILENVVAESYRTVTAGTYGLRARDGVRYAARRVMSGRTARAADSMISAATALGSSAIGT
jgi:hypothetical protein